MLKTQFYEMNIYENFGPDENSHPEVGGCELLQFRVNLLMAGRYFHLVVSTALFLGDCRFP